MSKSNLFILSSITLTISCLILIVINTIFGRKKVHRFWNLFNLSVAIWGLGAFMVGISSSQAAVWFWWKINHIGVIWMPVFVLHTAYLLTNKVNKKILIFAYAQGVFFQIIELIPSTLFFDNLRLVFSSFYYVTLGPLYHLFFALWILLVIYAHVCIFQEYRESRDIKRLSLLYFLIGSILGFSGGVNNFLIGYKIDILPYGNFAIPIYCIMVTYAIIKYRLMDVRIFISRALAFLISYTFLLGVPFFFAYRMYPVLQPIFGKHWWLAPAGLMAFFATLAPLAYDQIRRGVEERLLAEQKRYQKLLLQAASGMAREHNLNRLSKLIVYIVKRIVRIEFAAIFLEDKEHKTYRLKAVRDSGISGYTLEFSYDSEFIKLLKNNKEPYLYEELPVSIQSSLTFPKRISLIIPSLIEDNLLGFVVLGEKDNHEPYSEDDINVFKILTNQAAMTIENCLFFEEFKNAQEKIFTAEKLASIGGMADGVAHQIKNRLNHFSIASGELKCEIEDFIAKRKPLVEQNPDLAKTFEYAIEIANSLIKNVKMTDGIVRGILTYARVEEKETFFSHFSFKEVIDASVELFKIKHELQEFPLTIDLDNCDMIYGVKAQIMESMYNIIDNGYEASLEKKHHLSGEEKKKFAPLIRLKLTEGSHSYHIEISDNGTGIKDEAKQKIFAPFFTTKSSYKSGTGIGMYVVRRIVEENHKGRIWFESTYMQGTKFIIELPKK